MTNLEDTLLNQITLYGLPQPEREFHAVPGRRYRWDAAYPNLRLLIEIQGGTWIPGLGHSSGTGIRRDCEKNNAAVLAGYRVLYVTSDMVHNGEAILVIQQAIECIQEEAEE